VHLRAQRGSWAAVAALALGVACAPQPEPELLVIREVTPQRVEAASRLQVRGSGFPPGRVAQLRLDGRLHRPGEPARQTRVDLEGRALSGEVLEATLTQATLDALGRGTLHGQLTVAFEAAGDGSVVGRSPPLVLDVTPPSAERLGAALDHRRRAAELTERLGVSLGEEDPSAEGLPVETVAEGSPAASAGLVAGDRLVGLDGLRLHALSDLVPAPDADDLRLEVARPDEAGTFEVTLPLPARADGVSPALLRFGQAALAWVLLVALLLAPSASMMDWLVQARRLSSGPRLGLELLRLLVGGALFASLVALAKLELLRVPLEIVVVSTLAARAVAAHLGATPGARPLARVGALAGALGASVLAAVAISAVGAAGGTTDLLALHDQQGPAPWQWTAMRSPAGPLTVALVVAAGAVRPRQGGLGPRLATAIEETVALVLSAVLASVLLGGWKAPEAAHWAWTGIGPVLFVAKGMACWLAMRRVSGVGARGVGRAALAAAAAASAALWIAWAPPPEVVDALAEALTAVAVVAAVWLLHRRLVERSEPVPAPPHPFL
jgi:hypothetical protein